MGSCPDTDIDLKIGLLPGFVMNWLTVTVSQKQFSSADI